MSESHDVVIVGAGPAGSALAYFLASNGVDVAFVDKSNFPRDKTCGDGLTPRAIHVLKAMGVLDLVSASAFEIRKVDFFAPNGTRIVNPIPSFDGLPDFALVSPRHTFDNILRVHAIKAGANYSSPVTIVDVLREGQLITGVRAKTPSGDSFDIHARHTILATGASYSILENTQLLKHKPDFSRAARTYYEGVQGLSDSLEVHYDSVPLPGYGWIFPTSPTSANIGAGFYVPSNHPSAKKTPRQVLDEFIANPRLAQMLENAHATAPTKGYPLRFDFPQSQVAFPGLGLVGEACGLVNPFTGEGIDYALESAEIAAEILIEAIRQDESPQQTMTKYSNAFRGKFLPTYKTLLMIQKLYSLPWIMNRYVSAALRSDELAQLLLNVGFGNVNPVEALSLKSFYQMALG